MTQLHQKVTEMFETDKEIVDNLKAVKGAEYAELVSALADLVNVGGVIKILVPHPVVEETLAASLSRVIEATTRKHGCNATMSDIMMLAKSRFTGTMAVFRTLKKKGE